MSATADRSVRHKFMYCNMHAIWKSAKDSDPAAIIADAKPKTPFQSLKQDLTKLQQMQTELLAMLEDLKKMVE